MEEFLQLNVGLLQLLKHRLHMDQRAALRPETNAPQRVIDIRPLGQRPFDEENNHPSNQNAESEMLEINLKDFFSSNISS